MEKRKMTALPSIVLDTLTGKTMLLSSYEERQHEELMKKIYEGKTLYGHRTVLKNDIS